MPELLERYRQSFPLLQAFIDFSKDLRLVSTCKWWQGIHCFALTILTTMDGNTDIFLTYGDVVGCHKTTDDLIKQILKSGIGALSRLR